MKNNSLLIGKYIRKALVDNTALKKRTKGQIRALITLPNTTFPFITFKRTSVTPEGLTKDYTVMDKVTVEILCVSNEYDEAIEIASSVRNIIEDLEIDTDEITITETEMIAAEEGFEDEAFFQNLVFEMYVN